MSFFNNIILNLILVLSPIMMYLLTKIFLFNPKKDKYIFIFFSILSIIFLLIFSKKSFIEISLVIYIPLLFNYIKNNTLFSICISIFMIFINNYLFNINIYILTIEYLIYLLVYMFIKRKEYTNFDLINKFIIIKVFFMSFYLFSMYIKEDFNLIILYLVIYIVVGYVLAYLFNYLNNTNINIRELENINKKIENQDNIKNYLCAVTHELKNSLCICKGYLDMLQKNKNKEKYLKIIKKEINRSIDMIQDGLNLSKDKLNYEILDVNLLLEDVIDTLEYIFKQKKIKYKVNYIDDDIYIMGDYERLKQVLINILKNSIESKEKDLKIVIDNHILKNEICLSIQDNGCGIENINNIGKGFTNKIYGSGIGTSFSKNIIDKHNGKLIYESIKGEGTSVNILLPLFK